MTTVALDALPQFFDNSGNPIPGGLLHAYQAGTLIPLDTYTDRGGTVLNPNPVVLDAAGRASIWLQINTAYKLVLTDATGANVYGTVDDYYAGADPAQLTAAGIVPATGGTYTGLVNFNGGALFNGTPTQDLATLDSLGISAVQNANLWINSDFAFNNRASGTVADGTYGFDRTVALCETGSVALSQLAQPEDGMAFAMRTTQPDAGPKRVGFLQIVEAKNVLSYRGKNLSMTVRVRSSAATTVRVALVAWVGTADAPTRDVVNNWASTTYTAGNFFVANTLPIAVVAQVLAPATFTDITVSSASPGGIVVPSNMNNLYMVVWTDAAVAQNVTLDASCIRVGQGTTKQVWTPPDAATELVRCKRYLPFWRSTSVNDQVGAGQCISGTVALIYFAFDVEARAAVTTVSASGSFVVTNAAGAPVNLAGMSLAVGGNRSVLINAPVAAGLVAGNAATMQGTLASSLIVLNGAEL